MANNLKRAHQNKWPGVYCYESDQRKLRGKADVCFYITYKVDGRKKTEKVGWKSEGYSPEVAAEVRASRVKQKRHGNEVKTAKEIRREKAGTNRAIGELKEAYFNSEKGMALKGRKTDLNRYEKHLEELFDNKQVSSLCALDIERAKKEMKGHAPATVSNALELLRRIINYGAKNKLCPPLSFTIELPKKDNLVTEYLTPEQANRLMEVLSSWEQQDAPRMLQIAWLTGMRRGEIFKLEERDCDFQENLITLRDPKGAKTETVPMSKPVKELLQSQIQDKAERFPDSPFIFPGKNGHLRKDCSAVDRIKKEADLPKTFRIFHGLRHHLAVTLASSGEFTLDMIGALLTHKSHEMTKRYAKFLPDAKKKAADQAAALLQNHASRKKQDKVLNIKRGQHE